MKYTSPGVYVEEYLNPLSEVPSDPGDATAAFVGVSTGGGPVGPVQITSWTQYQQLFGSLSQTNDDLAHAVYNFFANGGTGCYVVRAVNDDATSASLTVQNATDPLFTVTAIAPGDWANSSAGRVGVYVTATPSTGGRFDFTVEVGSSTVLNARETFADLSMNPTDGRYFADVLNSPQVGSKFVRVAKAETYTFDPANPVGPAVVDRAPLAGGTNGTGNADLVEAVSRLNAVDRNLVVNVPAASGEVVGEVVDWAVASGRHFIVADVPRPVSSQNSGDSVAALTTFADSLPNSSHVAVYGPWVYTVDPSSKAGAMRLTAPGGLAVGQYLRTDASRGVHKAPAGVQTRLSNALNPYFNYSNEEQDLLYGSGINLIKHVPGAGVCIMGARTQGNGFPDRYISVRRLLISLKSSLTAITRFAVFENNDDDLRATVEDVVGNFLQGLYDLGSFHTGGGPEGAYYVRCDDSNNSPSDEDAGVVNVEVGVALKNPAEFIVIRLGQTAAGSTATDSLEEE